MTNKELLLKALKNETTPRPAWVPFVGVHGAHLLGIDARTYLCDPEKLAAGLLKANELYKPDGLPVAFDLQMEAEVLGCDLHWPKDGPPSVKSHPLEGGDLSDLPPFTTEKGRFPVVKEAIAKLRAAIGDHVALYGLLCGPFTLTMHLKGNDLFLDMFDEPESIQEVCTYCAGIAKQVAKFYLENGVDVVAAVDPMTSQISPEHFQEFAAPYLNDLFDFVRAKGGLSSLFVCGDATRNLEVMGETTCDNISIDENIPLELLRDITRGQGKSFGGNLKLTTVLLLGTEDDSKLDAIRCIDTGGGCGFVLAPGCDLPFATPPANLQAVTEMVHDAYKREVAKRTIVVQAAENETEFPLPDFAAAHEVHVDVVTLDSASCAPCQYMMDAVHRAQKQIQAPLIVKEHRITTREGIAAMSALGVSNIPTITIDGEVKFASVIPDQKTLIAAINEKVEAKKEKAPA